MALVLYSAYLSFPGGGTASNYFPIPVRPRASNQNALIFTDGTGTTPAANPATSDGDGLVSFYAAPGDYEAILAGERFHVPVDDSFTDPVLPDLWVHDQVTPASTWTIIHHFGIEPSVELLISGAETEAFVEHPDNETTVITFGSDISGVAHLRR